MTFSTEQLQDYLKNLDFESWNELQLNMLNIGDKNTILLSKTGSGKTVGFILPLIKMVEKDNLDVQAMIIAPIRELAVQIEGVFRSMKTGLKITTCYGGHNIQVEQKSFIGKTQVIIGTPGRICDHINRGTLDLKKVKTLVIDEYDKCLEFGFYDQLAFITDELVQLKQVSLVSATELNEIPSFFPVQEFETLNFLSASKDPEFVKWNVPVNSDNKFQTLLNLLCSFNGEQAIVFCNFREATEKIVEVLNENDYAAVYYHGGMEQDERERSLLKFRNGSEHTLVCTDLGSRGLDIPEIKHVIHFQYPQSEQIFIHRNGRTARIQNKGNIYLMINSDEPTPDYVSIPDKKYSLSQRTSAPSKPEWVTLYFSGGKKNKINKIDLVGFLTQKGGLHKDEIGLITVLDFSSFLAVKRNRISHVLNAVKGQKIKGQKLKIDIAR
jgi:ATP-dependent RNA helicase DeaD